MPLISSDRVSEHPTKRRIGTDEFPVAARQHDADRGFLIHTPKELCAPAQRALGLFALDRVADGSREHWAIEFLFGEVVLRAQLEGIDWNGVLRPAAENQHRDLRERFANGPERIQAVAIGQVQVEQHHAQRCSWREA